MNKKIFGKAAALSLAAVATLSTFAMTASADVTFGSQNTISGTAYRIDWTVVRADTCLSADYNETTHSVSFRTATYFETPLTSNDDIEVDTGATLGNMGAGSYYISSNTQATTMKGNITNAISAQKAAADTQISNWKKEWNDYSTSEKNKESDTKKFNDAMAALSETVTEKTYTASNGKQYTVTAATVSAPHLVDITYANQPAILLNYHTYSSNPNIVTKTMKQLSDELQTKTVIIDSGFILKGTSGNVYTINISDSSATNPSNPDETTNTWYPTLSSYRVPTTTGKSYKGFNGFWYTSETAAIRYGEGVYDVKTTNYSADAGTIYFSALDGYYYSSATLANTNYCYQVSSSYYSTKYGSYKAANGLYYPTIAAAQNASYAYNRTSTYSTKASAASARYLCMVDGKFYSSVSAAQAANSNCSSNYVIDLANYTGTTSGIYDVYDPYYYYFMMNGNGGFGTTTIDPDAPAIYGSTKKSGWNKIVSVVKTTAKGKTVTIDMNASTIVPEDVLVAAKSKGVNLKFVLANGATWTLKAADIKSTDTMNINVEYNTKNIKSSLVSKAKKLNPGAVSTAQISVSGSVDVNAGLTVKLSSKRAGCTVKAYIKTSSGSIKLVDKGVVNTNGKVTLDINQGGDYLLVVID